VAEYMNLIIYDFNHLGYLLGTKQSMLFQWPIRRNQLPVSGAKWQHGSQICFATFILPKIAKLLKTQNH
jgi:hypothetical protein